MFKLPAFFFTLFLFVSSLVQADEGKGKIEITATTVTSTKTTVKATGDLLVYYDDSVIKADQASFDKVSKRLKLSGNVEMLGYQGSKEKTPSMVINTDNKAVHFEQLYLVSDNDIWLLTDKAHQKDGNYTLGRSILSSCNVSDPLWRITFERSNYDSQAHYMKIYDSKLYFKDVPIFYTPYLAFSTNNERSSGLLFPLLGHNTEDGLIYEQPIFWAINENMDIEFNPQVRTNRSLGLYSTFRFAESLYSSGALRVGYFKDFDSYQKEQNTLEPEHFGLEFNYDASQFLQKHLPKEYRDGLYAKITYLNDIDYLNLQKTHLSPFGFTPLQESKINYYIYNETDYFGLNAKYFIDTREEIEDDETLQILPSLTWHRYLRHLIWDNLTYSIDTNLKHFYRNEGSRLKQAEVKLPIEFTTALFDDYLNITFREEFYYSKFFFSNGNFLYDDFSYYSNIHTIKFYTDLTKQYNQYIHVLQPSVSYVKPGNENESPVPFDSLDETQQELFSVGLPEEHFVLSMGQYFYDEAMNLKFFQRLSQKYYPNRDYKLADLSNEMQYSWQKWQFYNDINYAHEYGKIRESSTRVSLHKPLYHFTLGHTYKDRLSDDTTTIPANDVSLDFGYTWNDHISFSGGLIYDLDEAGSRQWRFGGTYKQDCWNMTTSVRQEITPRPVGFTKENSFYVQFNFVPFGGVGSGGEK